MNFILVSDMVFNVNVGFSESVTYRGRHTSCTISVVFEVDVSYPDLSDPAVLGPGLKVCSIDHNIGSECLLCDLLGNISWQPRSVSPSVNNVPLQRLLTT